MRPFVKLAFSFTTTVGLVLGQTGIAFAASDEVMQTETKTVEVKKETGSLPYMEAGPMCPNPKDKRLKLRKMTFPMNGTQVSPKELGSPNRPTIGLALGGGGTRGAAHVGVLKVL